MIIGVDAGCLSISDNRLKVGVYRMTNSFLRELSLIDKRNFYYLYSFQAIPKSILKKFSSRVENKIIKPSWGWMRIWLPLELQRHKVDVFLGFSQALPKLPSQTAGIVFVHDLTFHKYPKWFPKSLSKLKDNTKKAVLSAQKIIAVSQSTRNELVKIYDISRSKIEVIYEGLELISSKPHNLRIKKPYLLYVGTFKQSKNIPNIIKAFTQFALKNTEYTFVLAGSDYWLDPEIMNTISLSPAKNNIKIMGFVSDNILAGLYSNASVFISPSYSEGFGLTFLEAAKFKIPIITSRRGSIPEVLGNGASYVDPNDISMIVESIVRILNDGIYRKKLINDASAHIKKFSYRKSANKLLQIINSYE